MERAMPTIAFPKREYDLDFQCHKGGKASPSPDAVMQVTPP